MGNFDRDMLIQLYDVARLLRTRFDQTARTYGMTRAQWIILARLDRQPGMSQNELAAICEVEPISVARLVDRLEARGMVERRSDPADRRVRRLHLLPASRPILAEIARYRDRLDAELNDGLEPAAREAFVNVLLHIKAKLTADPPGEMKLAAAGE
ncbi:MAG TPA: MarR family transcriptional regulator [Rhizomicrobium sp.]|jgi:DNA-binding MarR family transcriptional regulator|nr:MarR family transcriptional regulator [Rhizomicrobium sp.]HWA23534.1 MarR family transcriptional regulator [Caulobacterales bacterium]